MTEGGLDMALVREAFESSVDFTVGLEEEFALLDADTLELTSRFEELKAAAEGSELDEHLVGERDRREPVRNGDDGLAAH